MSKFHQNSKHSKHIHDQYATSYTLQYNFRSSFTISVPDPVLVPCWYIVSMLGTGVVSTYQDLVHPYMVLALYGNVLYGAVCTSTANIASVNVEFE